MRTRYMFLSNPSCKNQTLDEALREMNRIQNCTTDTEYFAWLIVNPIHCECSFTDAMIAYNQGTEIGFEVYRRIE